MITLNCIRLMLLYTFQSYTLQHSLYICRTYKFLTTYFSHCAIWILCIISLERAAVTKHHIWNHNVFSRKNSYYILIIMYIILFFLNIHYLIFFSLKKHISTNNKTEYKILIKYNLNVTQLSKANYEYFLNYYFSWIDFLINSFIPFIMILIANTSIMFSVCKSRLYVKQLGLRQTRSLRDTQLASILFVSTLLFLLLTFPLRVFSVIEPYLMYEEKYLILLDSIMRFLLYVDHGCGFYLYTFTGELFRRELKKLIYEYLTKLFRGNIELKRQSELSYSNDIIGRSQLYHRAQYTNTPLRISFSNYTYGGNDIEIKTSFQTRKTYHHLVQNF